MSTVGAALRLARRDHHLDHLGMRTVDGDPEALSKSQLYVSWELYNWELAVKGPARRSRDGRLILSPGYEFISAAAMAQLAVAPSWNKMTGREFAKSQSAER